MASDNTTTSSQKQSLNLYEEAIKLSTAHLSDTDKPLQNYQKGMDLTMLTQMINRLKAPIPEDVKDIPRDLRDIAHFIRMSTSHLDELAAFLEDAHVYN